MIVTFLLFEKQKGAESQFYPYINSLPEDCECLYDWDDSDLCELQDSLLAKEALRRLSELSGMWTQLHDCLLRFPEIFRKESVDFGLIRWAYSICYTRSFSKSARDKRK